MFHQSLLNDLCHCKKNFATTVVTDSYTTSFLRIERDVIQGDCFSPLVFNLFINTFIQYVHQERFLQLSYSLSKLLRPIHWFQFADDASIATGQEYKTQVLLNAFSLQTHPKLFVNNEQIPGLKKQ